MKNRLAVVITIAALFLFSCPQPEGNADENTSSPVDFTSHDTDYSILIENNTGQRLVAFKGDLDAAFLIGGIPANAQNHGLPLNTTLFNYTGDFPMILLTEAQYEANKSNLQSQKNTPFMRVYVFYNKNGDNNMVYKLAAGPGGSNVLPVVNPSSLSVELRIGGVTGATIGYAPRGILKTKFFLTNGDYYIYPVFKRYNYTQDIVESVYPRKENGDHWYQFYHFDEEHPQDTMNLENLVSSLTMTSGAAWVVVQNERAVLLYE